MYLFKRTEDLITFLRQSSLSYRQLGFVPTMGALHAGHLRLIEQSLADNQLTVCSIFVNPTQFNEPTDLDLYPRTPAKDVQMLLEVGCDIVFLPTKEDIYPQGAQVESSFDLGGLDEVLEGVHRPGHFAGVVQVVKRLLDIVQPEHIYLGQKDYQQYNILRHTIKKLGISTEPVRVATVRESDGLAMSSRNKRLSKADRALAPLIYQTLLAAKERLEQGVDPRRIESDAVKSLQQVATFRPEYFSIVDGGSLQAVNRFADHASVVVCTAVWVGEVRLIDNLVVKE